MRALLEHDASVTDVSKKGLSALHTAARYAHDALTLILQAEPDLEATDDENRTALFVACEYGNEMAVQQLIAEEAAVNVRSEPSGATPLIHACDNGDHGIVSMLLEAQADILEKRSDGMTALMCAWNASRTLS